MARLNPGSLLVVGLLGLGVVAAATGIWFQWQQTRRCLAFYGVDTAGMISRAPEVELWLLAPAADGHTGRLRAGRRLDISEAKGLVHLRRGLVEDANFAWTPSPASQPQPDAAWDVALVFSAEEASAGSGRSVLAVDFGADPGDARLTVVGKPGRVTLGKMAKGLREWVTATVRGKGLTGLPWAESAGG